MEYNRDKYRQEILLLGTQVTILYNRALHDPTLSNSQQLEVAAWVQHIRDAICETIDDIERCDTQQS